MTQPELTREQVEEYRRNHLLPRALDNQLNKLDHQICDMALALAHLRSQPAGYVSVPVATVRSLYAWYGLLQFEKTGGTWPRDRFESWLDCLMEDAGLESRAFTEDELRAMLAASTPAGEGQTRQKGESNG